MFSSWVPPWVTARMVSTWWFFGGFWVFLDFCLRVFVGCKKCIHHTWAPATTSILGFTQIWFKCLLKVNTSPLGVVPLPLTVTTRTITCFVGHSYKPSFATATWRVPQQTCSPHGDTLMIEWSWKIQHHLGNKSDCVSNLGAKKMNPVS